MRPSCCQQITLDQVTASKSSHPLRPGCCQPSPPGNRNKLPTQLPHYADGRPPSFEKQKLCLGWTGGRCCLHRREPGDDRHPGGGTARPTGGGPCALRRPGPRRPPRRVLPAGRVGVRGVRGGVRAGGARVAPSHAPGGNPLPPRGRWRTAEARARAGRTTDRGPRPRCRGISPRGGFPRQTRQ